MVVNTQSTSVKRGTSASKRSAKWCREAVDVCWEKKSKGTRKEELAAAEAAYQKAREAYDKIIAESWDDVK